jgi:L-ascorbate metabolism protein UlaG (beta-lactamase superfamily)
MVRSMLRAAVLAVGCVCWCVWVCGCFGEPAAVPRAAEETASDVAKYPAEDRIAAQPGDIVVRPIGHASFVLQHGDKTVYVDPVGGKEAFRGLPKPDLVLVTHAHFDHLDVATLEGVIPAEGKVPLVATKDVAGKLAGKVPGARVIVLANGEKTEAAGVPVEAVPAYNTSPDRKQFHPKGRDNGYVLRLGGKTLYVAGDTEDTPEMRALALAPAKIDAAFLPMNKPYTMDIAQAADAVRQFRPKVVYPYHFRNSDKTMADLEAFRRAVGNDVGVDVRLLNWYPQ